MNPQTFFIWTVVLLFAGLVILFLAFLCLKLADGMHASKLKCGRQEELCRLIDSI